MLETCLFQSKRAIFIYFHLFSSIFRLLSASRLREVGASLRLCALLGVSVLVVVGLTQGKATKAWALGALSLAPYGGH